MSDQVSRTSRKTMVLGALAALRLSEQLRGSRLQVRLQPIPAADQTLVEDYRYVVMPMRI